MDFPDVGFLGANSGMDCRDANSGMDFLGVSFRDSYVGGKGYGVRGGGQNMGVRHADSLAPDGAKGDGSVRAGCDHLDYDLERFLLDYDLERARLDCVRQGCVLGFPRR